MTPTYKIEIKFKTRLIKSVILFNGSNASTSVTYIYIYKVCCLSIFEVPYKSSYMITLLTSGKFVHYPSPFRHLTTFRFRLVLFILEPRNENKRTRYQFIIHISPAFT